MARVAHGDGTSDRRGEAEPEGSVRSEGVRRSSLVNLPVQTGCAGVKLRNFPIVNRRQRITSMTPRERKSGDPGAT